MAASVIDRLRSLPNVTLSDSGHCDYLLVLIVSTSQGGYTCLATVLMGAKTIVSATVPTRAWVKLEKEKLVEREDIARANVVLEKAADSMVPCFIVGGSIFGSGFPHNKPWLSALVILMPTFFQLSAKATKNLRDAWNSKHLNPR